jgi:hypothetical protein
MLRPLSDADIAFLREFAHRVTAVLDDQQALWPGGAGFDAGVLFDHAPSDWINTIQVTPARASMKSSEALIDDVARQFLRAPSRQHRSRDRRKARALAYESLTQALGSSGVPDPATLVKTRLEVEGHVEKHEFDLAVENGRLVTAALALSFEGRSLRDLSRDYSAGAWAIEDVRKTHETLPLAVVMLPPVSGASKTYDQARHVFDALDARTVPEDEIEAWATEVAASVVAV